VKGRAVYGRGATGARNKWRSAAPSDRCSGSAAIRAAAVLVSYEAYEGFLATRDEMSYPDWERRLKQAHREAKQGKGISLDAYLKRRAQR